MRMPFCYYTNVSFAPYFGTFLGTNGLTFVCCSQALACGGGSRADALCCAGQAIGDVGNLRRAGGGSRDFSHEQEQKRNKPCTCWVNSTDGRCSQLDGCCLLSACVSGSSEVLQENMRSRCFRPPCGLFPKDHAVGPRTTGWIYRCMGDWWWGWLLLLPVNCFPKIPNLKDVLRLCSLQVSTLRASATASLRGRSREPWFHRLWCTIGSTMRYTEATDPAGLSARYTYMFEWRWWCFFLDVSLGIDFFVGLVMS